MMAFGMHKPQYYLVLKMEVAKEALVYTTIYKGLIAY